MIADTKFHYSIVNTKSSITFTTYPFNSLRLNDAIWPHRLRSTLAQVMACCLTAPSHCPNKFWFIINKVPWHLSGGIITKRSEDTNPWNKIDNYVFKIASRFSRDQRINVNCWGLTKATVLPSLLFWRKCYTLQSKTCVSLTPLTTPSEQSFISNT